VYICVSLHSVLGNGSVNTFLRQHTHNRSNVGRIFYAVRVLSKERVWVCASFDYCQQLGIKTFPRQRRIVRGVVFYEAHVVSKESRRSVLPRTSCLYCSFNPNITEYAYRSEHLGMFKILGYNRIKALHYYIVGCLRLPLEISTNSPTPGLIRALLLSNEQQTTADKTTNKRHRQFSRALLASLLKLCSSSTVRPS
jgi:hypothetical protein